jgi:hypothetical protein
MCQQEAPVLSKYKRMTVMVHDGKLNDMALNAIKVQIDDINQQDLEVKVMGNINTQSERLVEFFDTNVK